MPNNLEEKNNIIDIIEYIPINILRKSFENFKSRLQMCIGERSRHIKHTFNVLYFIINVYWLFALNYVHVC